MLGACLAVVLVAVVAVILVVKSSQNREQAMRDFYRERDSATVQTAKGIIKKHDDQVMDAVTGTSKKQRSRFETESAHPEKYMSCRFKERTNFWGKHFIAFYIVNKAKSTIYDNVSLAYHFYNALDNEITVKHNNAHIGPIMPGQTFSLETAIDNYPTETAYIKLIPESAGSSIVKDNNMADSDSTTTTTVTPFE
jgi:hypothetical protein